MTATYCLNFGYLKVQTKWSLIFIWQFSPLAEGFAVGSLEKTTKKSSDLPVRTYGYSDAVYSMYVSILLRQIPRTVHAHVKFKKKCKKSWRATESNRVEMFYFDMYVSKIKRSDISHQPIFEYKHSKFLLFQKLDFSHSKIAKYKIKCTKMSDQPFIGSLGVQKTENVLVRHFR